MNLLEQCLKEDEGFRGEVYLDTKNNPTGGWGHHFYVGSLLPIDVCEGLLRQDIAIAVNEYLKIPRRFRSRLNRARARVIVCMIFNMGVHRVMGFRDMWAAIEREDWPAVKTEMMDSKWALDVGDGPGGRMDRAERLAEIMLTGVWP